MTYQYIFNVYFKATENFLILHITYLSLVTVSLQKCLNHSFYGELCKEIVGGASDEQLREFDSIYAYLQ